MTAVAEERQPLSIGWHPWFRRQLSPHNPSEPVELGFGPASMYEVDEDAIPTGRLITPQVPPWDNCFTALDSEPVLRWDRVGLDGEALTVSLTSSCDHWVIFTEPAHAVCVEPQTHAPDAVNRGEGIVEAGDSLTATMSLTWSMSSDVGRGQR